jgi:tetratricopeptide (TPR) repeat protein
MVNFQLTVSRILLLCWTLLGAFPLNGQVSIPEAGEPETGLVPEADLSPGDRLDYIRSEWELRGIDSAVRNGFLGVARTLVDRLLAGSPEPAEREALLNYRLQIALVSGDLSLAGATETLLEQEGLRIRPLLAAFYAFFNEDEAGARIILDSIPPDSLSRSSRSWRHLLEALILLRGGQTEAANEAFLLAERTAPSALLRDHFEIIRIRERLRRGSIEEEEISALRESVRSMRGERGGFEAARLLAVALNRAGDSNGAIEVLNAHLALPGLREFAFRSDFLLLLGMIAGADSTRGQLALRQLISEAEGGENMAVALTLLSQALGEGYDREVFLADINSWLDRQTVHPLADRILAYKAYLQMNLGAFESAEKTATELINRFPNSAFVPTALRLLAYSSWNQSPPRYRTAADYLNQLRGRLSAGPEVLETGILIADCYFLNEDYTSASDAYGAVLAEAPAEFAGKIFFQRILSELGAGRPDVAAAQIDEVHADPRIDPKVVWRAEWNLLDFLRRSERIDDALGRAEALIETGKSGSAIPPELVLRMEWISARLTLEAGQPEASAEKAAALLEGLYDSPYNYLPDALLKAVQSHLLLLEGEARFLLGEKDSAMDSFRRLREQFPQSGPAILSYLVESRQETREDNLVNAQQSLINLVDRFPNSEYAPIALWEAALNAEQRGLNVHLQESITILERLVTEYPAHGLVYFARLKQGDLARRLNDFPTALLLYERLISQYPEHPELYRAELSRGDCLMALGSEDPSRYDAAAVIYERYCLLSSAPLPVRLEAGFKWAHSLRQQGDARGSQGVLWLLYDRFILDPDLNQPILIEAAGRYWMSRVLLELGNIQAGLGEVASAIRVYETIIRLDLPGIATATSRIENLR